MNVLFSKIDFIFENSEYNQKILQSQTADKPMVPRVKAIQHNKKPDKIRW